MKKFRLHALGIFTMALMSLSLFSCNDTDDQNNNQVTSRLMVKMTDAPGDYDEVNIEVLDVMIKGSSDSGDNGWISIGDKTQVGEGKIYDLLKLTGGTNIMLTDSLIPSGHLGQIRLVLGDNNTVVVDGQSFDLTTPSGQQSGLKLDVNQTLTGGTTYEFLLDFDVNKSIVDTGNSKYILKPVIRVSTSEASGVIKGIVSPAVDYQVLASVQQGEQIFSAFVTMDDKDGDATDGDGAFQINGIPSGTYTLTLTPDPTSGKVPITVANVIVANGKTTDVGNITFP
ncbi:MAG TPA: DUF4382 domain-containing protein [Flavobacterium sp.]|uniref:DUF4382 domain-containing protein n=1 Tax=Flavobacterium sp. TaxID=239 RepID=UPI002DB7153B|nr:DUF4382 domain-containing protein [Flavobacterium sp.]HEU4788141.1 DUF4382 domain-containing protein [Flavobacterium sp.]